MTRNHCVVLFLGLSLTALGCGAEQLVSTELSSSETVDLQSAAKHAPAGGYSFVFVDFATPDVPSATAHNGDKINIGFEGVGTFSFHPKTVNASGTFTISGAGGDYVGTWTATKLVSFSSFGSTLGAPDLPPEVWGGKLILHIELTGASGETHKGILTLTCTDFGNPPPGTAQGITLQIAGGQHFTGSWAFDSSGNPTGPTQGATFFIEL